MFRESLPPPPGSEAETVAIKDQEIGRLHSKIRALEATEANAAQRLKDEAAGGARSIFADLRDGKLVDVNDVFKTAKPWIRDIGPLFDNIRRREEKVQFARLVDDMSAKYHLSPAQQESLKQWLEAKSKADNQKFRDLMLKENAGIEEVAKASKDIRPKEGLDDFMKQNLRGEDLANYNKDRMTERAGNVEREAEGKVARLNNMVKLDEGQQDQVFSIMARSHRDFDPTMQLEGVASNTTPLSSGQSRDEAILNVLRPDQRQQYDEARAKRRADEEKRMNEVGMKLPANWDAFQD